MVLQVPAGRFPADRGGYVPGSVARPHRLEARLQSGEDRPVDLLLPWRGPSGDTGAADIREIAIPHGADIDEYEVAISDDLVGREPVRRSHVLAGGDERGDHVGHFPAQVVERLQRVARDLALAP